MKISLVAILVTLFASNSYSQENLSLNFGGTSQTNYFTEIKYENVSDKLIIKVSQRGKEYRFLFDTGAPNMITKTLFDQIAPRAVDPAMLRKVPIWDGGGKVDSLIIITLNEIAFGNVVFNNIPTLVSKDPFLFDCLKIDGIIGSNMLRNSIVQLSSKSQSIILTDQPEKLKLQDKPHADLYLNQEQSAPLIQVKLTDTGSADIPMLFDTGMSGFATLALKHFTLFNEHHIFSKFSKSEGSSDVNAFGIEKDTTKYRIQVKEIGVNGAVFKNVNLQTTLGDESIIGSRLLNYGIVTLDYKNKKFYFEPFKTPVDLAEGSFPVTITLNGNKAVVGVVWDHGLKDKISVGDQVLSIDDQDFTQISPCDFLLSTKPFEGKNKVMLKLKSANGKITKVTISKK